MTTWRERETELRELGVTDPGLLESARRATAGERVAARVAEVRQRLGLRDPRCASDAESEVDQWAAGGLIAALDLLGKGGPYGAGHSHEGTGSTERPLGLATLPGHQAMVGGAWDAAIRGVAWDEIHAETFEDEGTVRLAPWNLSDGRGGFLTIERPHGLDPEWWAPLTPWLEALARRVVLAHATGDCRWLSEAEWRGQQIHLGIEDAQALATLCACERERDRMAQLRDRAQLSMQSGLSAEDVRAELWNVEPGVPWNWAPRNETILIEEMCRWAAARAAHIGGAG